MSIIDRAQKIKNDQEIKKKEEQKLQQKYDDIEKARQVIANEFIQLMEKNGIEKTELYKETSESTSYKPKHRLLGLGWVLRPYDFGRTEEPTQHGIFLLTNGQVLAFNTQRIKTGSFSKPFYAPCNSNSLTGETSFTLYENQFLDLLASAAIRYRIV